MGGHGSVTFQWGFVSLLAAALFAAGGCVTHSVDESGGSEPTLNLFQMQDQFLTHVVGAEGRVKMPIDVVQASAVPTDDATAYFEQLALRSAPPPPP